MLLTILQRMSPPACALNKEDYNTLLNRGFPKRPGGKQVELDIILNHAQHIQLIPNHSLKFIPVDSRGARQHEQAANTS